MSPELIARTLHDDEWQKMFVTILDDTLCAVIDPEKKPLPEDRTQLHALPKISSPDEIKELAEKIALLVNVHSEKHTYSCVKVHRHNSRNALVCRFGVKFREAERTQFLELELEELTRNIGIKPSLTEFEIVVDWDKPLPPLDERIIVFNLKRTSEFSRRVPEFNDFLTLYTGGNTSVQFLGSEGQARAVVLYLSGYLSKNPIKVTTALPVIHRMFGLAQVQKSTGENADTPEGKTQFLKTKMLMGMASLAEYADTQAACSILNIPSTVSSQKFEYLHMKAALSYQRKAHNLETIAWEDESHEIDADHVQSIDDGEDDHWWAGMRALKKDARTKLDFDEMYTIYTTHEGKLVSLPQYMFYRYIGKALEDLCL